MKLRKLGRKGPQVSAIGLGCMGFSEFYASDAATEADAIAVIQKALARGLSFLDTADMYGPYSNEILIGKALAGRRGQAFIATKFGIQRDPSNPKLRGINGKPDYVRSSCEGSLKRLNVERIDLYYQHRVDRRYAHRRDCRSDGGIGQSRQNRRRSDCRNRARRRSAKRTRSIPSLPCKPSTPYGVAIRRTAFCKPVTSSA